jgi:hypothetical protein
VAQDTAAPTARMQSPSTARRLARDAGWFLAAGLGGAALLASYYVCLVEEVLPVSAASPDATADVRMRLSGIRLPRVRPAADAGLDDSAEVIGVSVGGRARAYFVGAMGLVPTRHVVNDLLGGQSVSVTYCDRNGCARVFTGGSGAAPLEMGLGGFKDGGLLLRAERRDYAQTMGDCVEPGGGPPLPYEELPYLRTTWKAWREQHPDTDVYVGDPPEGQMMPGGPIPEPIP